MTDAVTKRPMRWVSAVSTLSASKEAIMAVIEDIAVQLEGKEADLLCVFISSHHAPSYELVPALLSKAFPGVLILGCSAGSVIGGGDEIEQRPGISLTAAILPDVMVTPFHLLAEQAPKMEDDLGVWQGVLNCRVLDNPHFVLLPEPFSFHPQEFLEGLDQLFPDAKKVGGLASGGQAPGENVLYLGNEVYREGMVGIGLSGNIQLETIVAQGCRPLGMPMFVTKGKENILFELDGSSALQVLHDLYESLDATDRALFQSGLLLGVVMREAEEEYRQGDFLIRNIIGMDPMSEAIAVGTSLHENQVIQFHVRDAAASLEDLRAMILRHQEDSFGAQTAGALMFSCLGRGQSLYGRSNHDSDLFREHLGEIPLTGFFCNGEIGPVYGSTFLHGYTSAFGLFREKDAH